MPISGRSVSAILFSVNKVEPDRGFSSSGLRWYHLRHEVLGMMRIAVIVVSVTGATHHWILELSDLSESVKQYGQLPDSASFSTLMNSILMAIF